jgi:hypothetical protein
MKRRSPLKQLISVRRCSDLDRSPIAARTSGRCVGAGCLRCVTWAGDVSRRWADRGALSGRKARACSRERQGKVARSGRALFERSPDASAEGALDLISKNVVPNAEVIAPPGDHARPGQAAEETAARPPPSRAGDPPSHDAGKGPQERLKSLATPNANEQVQMRAHVGKIVDANPEASRHLSKRVAHGALVPAERPDPAGPFARQNHVHGAARADGALELAAAPPDCAAVGGSHELGVDVASEKRLLHKMKYSHSLHAGQCCFGLKCESDSAA